MIQIGWAWCRQGHRKMTTVATRGRCSSRNQRWEGASFGSASAGGHIGGMGIGSSAVVALGDVVFGLIGFLSCRRVIAAARGTPSEHL